MQKSAIEWQHFTFFWSWSRDDHSFTIRVIIKSMPIRHHNKTHLANLFNIPSAPPSPASFSGWIANDHSLRIISVQITVIAANGLYLQQTDRQAESNSNNSQLPEFGQFAKKVKQTIYGISMAAAAKL